MRRIHLIASLCLMLLLLPSISNQAQSDATQDTTEDGTFRVATKLIEPFVMEDDEGNLVGFSIDLWDEIANRVDFTYEWARYETVSEIIDAVEAQEVDAAIAAISITSDREQRIDFTYDYYDSGLLIIVPNNLTNPVQLVQALLNPALLQIFAVFAIIIVIAAHIYWLTERNRDPNFPTTYAKGIWEGIWWATVTVTTVGYGDRTPHGVAGRVMAIVWMFMGLFLIANFTASVTSVITVEEIRGSINNLSDLRGRAVVTLDGSTSETALRERGINPMTRRDIDAAYDTLLEGRADAIVYDAPVLMYYAANAGAGQVNIVGSVFNEESYGIALPQNDPYREAINLAILEIIEDGSYQDLYMSYFGAAS